jgi:O-antigen ligase
MIYAGYGRGSGPRWKRTGLVLGSLVVLGVATAVMTALALEEMDIIREAGTRLTSMTGTQIKYATRSNLIRLGEYLVVLDLIRQSPWVGYGIGYTFLVKQAFAHTAGLQWYVHQYFLMVWLKQGLVGLALFVWLLVAAIRLGAREARRTADSWESSWFATTAAATVFLSVFSLSNYPFAVVNEMFLLALLWGGSMAMTRKGFVSLRWSISAPP